MVVLKAKRGFPDTFLMLKIAVGWARLTGAVALIIEFGPYYAQMSFTGDLVYAEVISHPQLRGLDPLSLRQKLQLADLGWQIPELACRPACDRRHPNFHRLWTWDVPTEDIVSDVLSTLLEVHLRSEEEPDTPVPARSVTPIPMTESISHERSSGFRLWF